MAKAEAGQPMKQGMVGCHEAVCYPLRRPRLIEVGDVFLNAGCLGHLLEHLTVRR